MSIRRLFLVAVVAGGAGLPVAATIAPSRVLAVAAVQTPELLFDQGKRLFDTFKYDEAVPVFDRIVTALNTPPQVQKPDLLVQTLELRARARFALGDSRGTEQDFALILTLNPRFRLGPGISPRVTQLFENVRKITVGQLALAMKPAGEVQIDGRPYTAQAEAQTLDLTAGDHEIKVARQGYTPVSQRFRVNPGEVLSMNLELERVSATLSITSIPDGVDISLDGAVKGKTVRADTASEGSAPLVLSDIAPGTHRLLLHRDCYRDVERTLMINQPDDIVVEPVRLAPAVATVRIQTTETNANVFIDGVAKGLAPTELSNLCEGAHVIEVKGPRGRFVDRRDWKTGDNVSLAADLRSAFPIVSVRGATTAMLEQVRSTTERSLAPARRVIVYQPSEPDLQAAIRGETMPPDWMSVEVAGGAPLAARVPREVTRDLGRRLATKLESQGVATVTVGSDPYVLGLSLLAAGSGEPDVLTINTADPASRTRATDLLSTPLPAMIRPSLETSVIDLASVQGAMVVRPGGAGGRAGLAAGDLIVGAGGTPVNSVADLRTKIAAARPPALDVALDVRGPAGATRRVNVTLAMVADTIPMRDASVLYNRALIELTDQAAAASTVAERSAAHLNLAIVHMRLGNYEEAQTELRAVQLADGPGVSAGTVAYLTGLCLEAVGRTTDAQASFTRAAAAPLARLSSDGPLVAPLAQQKLRR